MKLISLNIELNRHRDKVLSFLKKESPDVICLQEILEEDFPIYKKELQMEGALEMWYLMNFTKDSRHIKLNGQKHGVAIFTKKILNSGSIYYNKHEESIDRPVQDDNVLLWIETEDNKGEVFKFMTTHLPVTVNGETTDYQLQVVSLLIKELEKNPEFVFCGDTNAPRGREAFSLLANKYKDNIPQEDQTSLDQNLHRVKGLIYMVDGLFTTPGYKAENVRLVDGVSDHMAIVADIKKA